MEFAEIQAQIRNLSNEILELSKQMRTHSTTNINLQLINIKLRAAQQRFDVIVQIQKENE